MDAGAAPLVQFNTSLNNKKKKKKKKTPTGTLLYSG
jgi:hypothetical protein